MFAQAEDGAATTLLLIRANAFERARAVMESMREEADASFFGGNDLTVEPNFVATCHNFSLLLLLNHFAVDFFLSPARLAGPGPVPATTASRMISLVEDSRCTAGGKDSWVCRGASLREAMSLMISEAVSSSALPVTLKTGQRRFLLKSSFAYSISSFTLSGSAYSPPLS